MQLCFYNTQSVISIPENDPLTTNTNSYSREMLAHFYPSMNATEVNLHEDMSVHR